VTVRGEAADVSRAEAQAVLSMVSDESRRAQSKDPYLTANVSLDKIKQIDASRQLTTHDQRRI